MRTCTTLLAAAFATFGFIELAGADDTSNLTVTASVSGTCTITDATLAFGAYDPISGTAVDGSTTIDVACTSGTSTTITLGQGLNSNTGSTDAVPLRRMSDGAIPSFLSYALYQNAARTTIWGNTLATGVPYTATTSAPTTLTVYGTIAANQDVPAGAYSDTVVATIAF